MTSAFRHKSLLIAALCGLLASAAIAALPGNSAEGKRLLETRCTGCHDASVYSRPKRSVRSLDALKQQLATCGHAANDLSASEQQHIVRYLNEQYYRFPD
jgi:hypothetical protein